MSKYRPPLNDLEYSRRRLDLIMGRRRLSFNPYTVSDKRLMEIVDTTGWGGEYDIVQIVKMHFSRLREVKDSRGFDGIYIKVGTSQEEIFLPVGIFKYAVTALDTLRQMRSTIGKHIIRNEGDVEMLVGKTVFVSRTIRAQDIRGWYCPIYRMHRLKGKLATDAATVRRSMCEAKIEMLRRILDYPDCYHYLDCMRGFFDYQTRIQHAIRLIQAFPNVVPPKD